MKQSTLKTFNLDTSRNNSIFQSMQITTLPKNNNQPLVNLLRTKRSQKTKSPAVSKLIAELSNQSGHKAARLLYELFETLAMPNRRFAWIEIDQLCKLLNCSQTTIYESLQLLVENKFLVIEGENDTPAFGYLTPLEIRPSNFQTTEPPMAKTKKPKREPMADATKVKICSSLKMMNRYMCWGPASLDLPIDQLELLPRSSTYFKDHSSPAAVAEWKTPQFVGFFWSLATSYWEVHKMPLSMPPFSEICGRVDRMLDPELGWGMTRTQLHDYIERMVNYFDVIRLLAMPLTLTMSASIIDHRLVREKMQSIITLTHDQILALNDETIRRHQTRQAYIETSSTYE